MSNLHAPTVPSGPTTARIANGNSTQLSIAELQRKKDIIEGELKALGGVLDSVCLDWLARRRRGTLLTSSRSMVLT
jgi:26S proteasome non-ATPase regulatory subunit 9